MQRLGIEEINIQSQQISKTNPIEVENESKTIIKEAQAFDDTAIRVLENQNQNTDQLLVEEVTTISNDKNPVIHFSGVEAESETLQKIIQTDLNTQRSSEDFKNKFQCSSKDLGIFYDLAYMH